MLTGDVTVDDGAPDLKNKKGECAPRHGDEIADFFFQGKTSLRVRTIANPSQGKNKQAASMSKYVALLLTIPKQREAR